LAPRGVVASILLGLALGTALGLIAAHLGPAPASQLTSMEPGPGRATPGRAAPEFKRENLSATPTSTPIRGESGPLYSPGGVILPVLAGLLVATLTFILLKRWVEEPQGPGWLRVGPRVSGCRSGHIPGTGRGAGLWLRLRYGRDHWLC
jgi:hypothetical protein